VNTNDCETELLGSPRPDVIVIHAIQHVKPNFDASAKRDAKPIDQAETPDD
jgi:hypothetical protein